MSVDTTFRSPDPYCMTNDDAATARQTAAQSWPNECPPDLRPRLEEVLSMRSHGPAEIWGVVQEWLVKHGATSPSYPSRPRPPE